MDIVLVHGSWHDGSCWDEVASRLRDAGHAVLTPTLAGNGDPVRPDVTLAETIDGLVADVVESGMDDLALVAHSWGGVVVQLAAERLADRTRHVVFHNAYVLEDGETAFDHIPAESAAAFQALAEAAGDGTVSLPFDVWHQGFINDADEATARSAFERLSPEPLARAAEPVSLSTFASLDVARTYVHATDDMVFPEPFSWHPGMSSRLGDDHRLVTLAGSHELLFSNPAALAEAIHGALSSAAPHPSDASG